MGWLVGMTCSACGAWKSCRKHGWRNPKTGRVTKKKP